MDLYHSKYNLTKTTNEFILTPLEVKQDNALQKSLMKGYVQSVSFFEKGEGVNGFIETNPKERTLNVFESHMKPLTNDEKGDLMDILPQQNKKCKTRYESGNDIKLKKRTRKQGNGVKI